MGKRPLQDGGDRFGREAPALVLGDERVAELAGAVRGGMSAEPAVADKGPLVARDPVPGQPALERGIGLDSACEAPRWPAMSSGGQLPGTRAERSRASAA
jgi:hypothetical protein